MDRFIDTHCTQNKFLQQPLKSNMDRFIVSRFVRKATLILPLKSNMDRFIATALASAVACLSL